MIFIKNKKAWKQLMIDNNESGIKPESFPCYSYIEAWTDACGVKQENREYITQFDAQSMLEKLENGREF